jgi:hypothetical protein
MMKIGELYRRDGVWNGQQIVPSAWIQQCISALDIRTKIGDPDDYGLLWWIIGEPEGAGYYASGFGGQRIVVLPKSRAVIVYMSDVQPDSKIDDSTEFGTPRQGVYLSFPPVITGPIAHRPGPPIGFGASGLSPQIGPTACGGDRWRQPTTMTITAARARSGAYDQLAAGFAGMA